VISYKYYDEALFRRWDDVQGSVFENRLTSHTRAFSATWFHFEKLAIAKLFELK
jgi:hypothetical protein